MKEELPTFENGKSYLLRGETLNAIISAIRARTPLDGEGMRVHERTPNGFRFAARTASVSPSEEKALSVRADGTVKYGTVCAVVPQIGGAYIDATPSPALSIPASGTYYIRATISGSFQTNAAGNFIKPSFDTSSVSVDLSVEGGSSGPAGLISGSGEFYFDLAVFSNGVKAAQQWHGPIGYELCDQLDGGNAAIQLQNGGT